MNDERVSTMMQVLDENAMLKMLFFFFASFPSIFVIRAFSQLKMKEQGKERKKSREIGCFEK